MTSLSCVSFQLHPLPVFQQESRADTGWNIPIPREAVWKLANQSTTLQRIRSFGQLFTWRLALQVGGRLAVWSSDLGSFCRWESWGWEGLHNKCPLPSGWKFLSEVLLVSLCHPTGGEHSQEDKLELQRAPGISQAEFLGAQSSSIEGGYWGEGIREGGGMYFQAPKSQIVT